MKFLRYGLEGQEKPGILDTENRIRDISMYVNESKRYSFSDRLNVLALSPSEISALPLVTESVRLGACVNPGKIICIGFNSALHAKQLGFSPMSAGDMVVFMKPSSAACGPNDPILFTRMTKKLDWEAELAVVIGKQGKYISKENARDHIFGYACMNDLSDRYLQLESDDKQFTKGKCFDNAAPLGPYLVTKDEILDSSDLQVKLWVNGVLRQDFNTNDYIHNDTAVISYVSQFFTLYPGDVISMGSAPGNAQAWGDNMFLKPDDKVEFSIEGLGQQSQVVVRE